MHTAPESAVSSANDILSSHDLCVLDESVGDELGCLEKVRRVTDDAWDQDLAVGQSHIAPHIPVGFMANVCGFDAIRANLQLLQDINEVAQRRIRTVRPVPAAPA